jgi:hypothetical protein
MASAAVAFDAEPILALYLRLSKEAVEYTKSKVKMGAANRPADAEARKAKKAQPLDNTYLERQRSTMKLLANEAEKPKRGNAPEIIDMDDRIRFDAGVVESAGFGNCGEQAAVAYKYLARLPLAGLVYLNLVGGNHTFVVLGASAAVIQGHQFSLQTAKSNLGDNAVICDPWAGGGIASLVKTDWDRAVELMLKEAAPIVTKEKVQVSCLCRCPHKSRKTKVAEWEVKNYWNELSHGY